MQRSLQIEEKENGYVVMSHKLKKGEIYDSEDHEVIASSDEEVKAQVDKWLKDKEVSAKK